MTLVPFPFEDIMFIRKGINNKVIVGSLGVLSLTDEVDDHWRKFSLC